jgi:hypothetical protein
MKKRSQKAKNPSQVRDPFSPALGGDPIGKSVKRQPKSVLNFVSGAFRFRVAFNGIHRQ